ncbi:MAG: T9SS type A sorting domain-containing protein [candidate division WOR-3 bacterium]|nr:T9SS type A sorting domain-containing protein [candidate division WOR-3 bacterium]
MNRREFIKILLGGGASVLLNRTYAHHLPSLLQRSATLPPPQVNTFSSEIIMNSRRSYHGGYSGTLSEQILANALWAGSRAPVIGTDRTIYVALPDNVYEYDPVLHDIILHQSGNHLSESNLAFEIGVASNLAEDAGTALHYAHLAAISFWNTTSSQPSCCPKESARNNANSTWNPSQSVQIANCYGLMGTVSGVTSQCVAISSNGSLPDPSTDGPVILETALGNLNYGDEFMSTELNLEQLSQLAWASYGNTPHTTSNNRGGLTAASAVANYYLTGRIYMVRSEGVERYHIRLPSGQPSTRDHRIERVTDGDRRPQLRSAVPRIPQTAPAYFVYCAATADRWQLIEAGYCAAGALLQASSMELQGYFTAGFDSTERTAIINALGIPATDLPLMVFSGGQEPVGIGESGSGATQSLSAYPNPFSHSTDIRYQITDNRIVNGEKGVRLRIYDASGRLVRDFGQLSAIGYHSSVKWDGVDEIGRRVPEGNYYIVIKTASKEYRQKITKIR